MNAGRLQASLCSQLSRTILFLSKTWRTWSNAFSVTDEDSLNSSITLEFSKSVITFLIGSVGVPKSQLGDWKMSLFREEPAVLTPHIVVLITVASIAAICALLRYSACALVQILGSCSTPIQHFFIISRHPPAIRIPVEQNNRVVAFVFDKLFALRRYCS